MLTKQVKVKKKPGKFIFLAAIIIVGLLTYSNSLTGKFLWDDEFLIQDNLRIKNWSNFPKLFTEDIGAGAANRCNRYRPLQIFTYLIDYSLWKLNPLGYHLTNIFLHILVALSIFWFVNYIFKDQALSFLTAVFFVAHPIHTGAVAYISGRSDPLAFLFILITFILYLKQTPYKSLGLYILMVLSYIAALLSRENSLILPALILLYHYTFKEKIKLKKFVGLLAITGLYIVLRITVLKELLTFGEPVTTGLLERLPGFFVAITNYSRLLFLPFDLHMEYTDKLFLFTELKVMIGIIIVVVFLWYAFRQRNRNKLITFSIFWFFIGLAPVSNLYPIRAYMAEHWLYLPSMGFFLLLAEGLNTIYKQKGLRLITLIFTSVILISYSYLTIQQNNYWQGPLIFYTRTLKYAPGNKIILNNLGNIYKANGKTQEAIAYYQKAIKVDPNFAIAYNNLGNTYIIIGRYKEAIESLQNTIAIDPEYALAYYNLGQVYTILGKSKEALAFYKKAIEFSPDQVNFYCSLAKLYKSIGNKEEAIIWYEKAIALDPTFIIAYNNLGNLYVSTGKKQEAIKCYQGAIRIDPHFAVAYYNLANLYTEIGNIEEAKELYKKILSFSQDFAPAYKNLAKIYYFQNKHALAIKYYDLAIELGYKAEPEFLRLLAPYRKKPENN